MTSPTMPKSGFVAALAAAVLAAGAAQAEPLYRITSTQVIKSPNTPNWDYLSYDGARSILYISRREDGILVYDTRAGKLRGTIEQTGGGNAVVLAPDLNRGFALSLDGAATVFDLGTRKVVRHVKFGDDADNGSYDPVTRQVMVTRGDSKQVTFLDATTGEVSGHLAIDSKKIEGSAADGQGNLYVALRDRNQLLRIDARTRRVTAAYPTGPQCELPNGLAFDARHRRVLVGCRGDKPVLAAFDADDGRLVAATPIGRGNDIVIFDAEARRIYTSNGVDANMVVIDQVEADRYQLVEATTTRPNARTMAFDPASKDVYLVAAEGAVDATRAWNQAVAPFYPNTYFKDTFTLLKLQRR